MQGPPGIETRLDLVWDDDEVRGRLARDAPARARNRRAWRGLLHYGLGLANRLAVFAGLAALMMLLPFVVDRSGALPFFVVLVVALFVASVAIGVFAVLQFPLHGLASWFGRSPLGFRVTETVLELTHGPDETMTRSPEGSVGAIVDRPGYVERHVLPLADITSVEAIPGYLEIELASGQIERFQVDRSVGRGDLEALVRFVRDRVAIARQRAEDRATVEPLARRALSSVRHVGSRES